MATNLIIFNRRTEMEHARLIVLFTGIVGLLSEVSARPLQQPTSPPFNGPECTWLMSNLGSSRTVSVGQSRLMINAATAEKLDSLRAEMAALGTPGAVVYAPFIAAGKVTMMRLESRSEHRSPLLHAHQSDWNAEPFERR